MIPKSSALLPYGPASGRRARCEHCRRPSVACICRYAVDIRSSVEVLILQHPLEVSHPKGSARLLHLSLPDSRLLIGERFPEATLHEVLCEPSPSSKPESGARLRQPILLYPDTVDVAPTSIQAPSPLDPSCVRLVVLDGTWRKSRRMLHENPVLQTLPRLALDTLPPSRYRIRHAYRPDQLSTLEATCHALSRLEQDEEKYQPLLHAFDKFIETQQAWFPSA